MEKLAFLKTLKAQVESLSALIESELRESGGDGEKRRSRERREAPNSQYDPKLLSAEEEKLLDLIDWLKEEAEEKESPLYIGSEFDRRGIEVYPLFQTWVEYLAARARSLAESGTENTVAACNAAVKSLSSIAGNHSPGYCFGLGLNHRPRTSWADEADLKRDLLHDLEKERGATYIVERD